MIVSVEYDDIPKVFSCMADEEDISIYPGNQRNQLLMLPLPADENDYTGVFPNFCRKYYGDSIADTVTSIHQSLEQIGRLSKWAMWKPIFETVRRVSRGLMVAESYYPVKKGVHGNPWDKPYRDHLLHPATVLILGQEFLKGRVHEKNMVEILTDRITKSKLGTDALLFANLQGGLAYEEWRNVIEKAWVVVGISHDIAYGLDPSIEMTKDVFTRGFVFEFSAWLSNIVHRDLVNFLIGANGLKDKISKEQYDLLYENFLKEASKCVDGGNLLDHGEFLACLWMRAYFCSNWKSCLEPTDYVILFLVLSASYRHDKWSKPENIDLALNEQDPWTSFFCLVDLLAEIRLIWDKVECKERSSHSCKWTIDIWFPFSKIEAKLQELQEPKALMVNFFVHEEIAEKLDLGSRAKSEWEKDGFYFEKATGAGSDNDAVKKKDQYESISRILGFLDKDEQHVGVRMSAMSRYNGAYDFWRRCTPKVMGDFAIRPRVVEIVKMNKPRIVLEAGCGTGYLAGLLKAVGLSVFGCDIEFKTADIARRGFANDGTGPQVIVSDIRRSCFRAGSFDAVVSVGVLIHFDEEELLNALREFRRMVKMEGRVVFSVLHPYLFSAESPARKGGACWIKLDPLEKANGARGQRFRERYYDIDGKSFASIVWEHSLEKLFELAGKAGLEIQDCHVISVSKDYVRGRPWGEECDYPAYAVLVGVPLAS